MKLFIQVAFDLEDCKKPEYDKIGVAMRSIGLSRYVYDEVKKTSSDLPANTFAGVRDCYSSHQEAIDHIRKEFDSAAYWDFFSGHVFVTVSPADETTHDVFRFKPSGQ